MKNFGTIIDNFDAVTKQYVDNKVPTDEHIKGIKVDNATLADTAKKVQNAFTYKAHDKTDGTAVSISYDGSEAASLDFVADDFAPVYTSGNDLGLKLVDKGYATKTYVDNQDALKLDKAGGSITGNLTVGGNLTINGTTTTVDSTTLQVKDKLIEVAHGNTTTLTTPAGLVAPKYDGTNSGALVFDSTGTAYVGDVTLKDGNIDVDNSYLQPLATRTGLVGGNLVQYDSSAQTLKDAGKKISDLALKTDIPTNYVTTDTTQTISGEKTFVSNIYISQTSGQNAGITWQSASDNTNRAIFRHYDDGTTENFVTQSDGFLFRPLNNNNTKSIKVDPKTGVLYPEQNSGADLGKTAQRWNAVYAGNTGVRSTGNIICDSKVVSYSAVESNNNVPNFNGILKDDLYTKAPTTTRGAQYLARDTNGAYIGGLRVYHNTDGSIQTQLMCRSQNTNNQKNVALVASKDSTGAAGDWRFVPNGDAVIDLGASSKRWNNGYITNLQNCKVINGGGGNSLIQQNSDTAGADITVGSTNCALKMLGKSARPVYKQGKNGAYANLALQSDIPIPFCMDDLSTGTFGSTTLGRSTKTKAVYFEDRDTSVCGFLYGTIYTSPKLYYLTNVSYESTSSGSQYTFIFTKYTFNSSEKMIKSTHKIALVNGKADYNEQVSISGTFYYKVLE